MAKARPGPRIPGVIRLPVRPATLLGLVVTAALPFAAGSGEARPPAEPAKIRISVTPAEVARGGRAEVTLELTAAVGVKINRYPKVKLSIAPREGLVSGGEATLGNDAPPPPDQTEGNYFHGVEPIRVGLGVDPSAAPGRHELDATVTYFYCVTASGFCAPSRNSVKVPIQVR